MEKPVAPPLPDITAGVPRVVVQGTADALAQAGVDAVDCTVFAPASVEEDSAFLVQAFVHLPAQQEETAALAADADPSARRRGFRRLRSPVARGSTLTIDLRIPEVEIDEPVQSLVWDGRPEAVQFGVTVPPLVVRKPLVATVTVGRGGMPIGHVKFTLAVGEASRLRAPHRLELEPVGDQARRYNLAFVSYASADRAKVLARVQMLGTLGIRYFQDVLELEPGDRWERKLYERIDECDLFLLFWSAAASESPWVRKEARYALQRKGDDEFAPPEIRPIIIEGPPVPPPHPELSHLHFSDKLIYFMDGERR